MYFLLSYLLCYLHIYYHYSTVSGLYAIRVCYTLRFALLRSVTFTLHPRSDTTHSTAHAHGPHHTQTHQHWLTDTRTVILKPTRRNRTETRNHTKHSTQQRGTGQNKTHFPFRVVVGK
jgi:hypothetical protein